ncbi:MAG: hypothetical protein IIW30_02220 [Flavobacteriales bacterium]|jgi:hypothetical protein|nr:hypothetical protein [Flavobacteriales bacterium]
MVRLFFLFWLSLFSMHLYSQERFLSSRDFTVDSLVLCDADERTVSSKWGVPYRVSYGSSPVSTLDGGISDNLLVSTMFYYPQCTVSFYTYEVSQWIYMVRITGGDMVVRVGEGLDFKVGDSMSVVVDKLKEYITPSIKKRLSSDDRSITFHTIDDDNIDDCPMMAQITFVVGNNGVVTEIKIGMVKNR